MQQDNDIVSAASNIVTADAVTERKVTKQYPLVLFPEDKATVQDIKVDIGLKNDMEAANIIIAVAMANRYDSDGNDRFAAMAEDFAAKRAKMKIDKQIAEAKALIEKYENR
jgi:fructose-bisphosphate aldolase class 1